MKMLERVRSTIRERGLIEPGEVIVVAVSGGSDSLALLRALRGLAPELGFTIHVAHLNHQLRGEESKADAEFVAALARDWGLGVTVEERSAEDYAREHRLSIEEASRVVRYRFLAATATRVGAHSIAIAHNQDDQAETVLMHFLRGSGLAGLRGMQWRGSLARECYPEDFDGTISLIRPLLSISREEIEEYCRAEGLVPRFDASNLDVTIFRNRLRHQVIPDLERLNPNLKRVLAHSAEGIADDYAFLREVVEGEFVRIARKVEGGFVFDQLRWEMSEPSMQRATMREAVARLRRGLRNINWVHIEEARRVALEEGAGAEATLPQGLAMMVGYGEFTIGETTPLPDWPLLTAEAIHLRAGTNIGLPESEWRVRVVESDAVGDDLGVSLAKEESRWKTHFDADKVRGQMWIRPRQTGDRFQPIGMEGHSKSLHDLMINSKVPRHAREVLPVLCDDEKILWVCGLRLDARAAVSATTKRIYSVEFVKE